MGISGERVNAEGDIDMIGIDISGWEVRLSF